MTDPSRDLAQLAFAIAAWQAKTFPAMTAHGAADHLAREVDEVWNHYWSADSTMTALKPAVSGTREERAEELADAFHLLIQLATLDGIDLPAAIAAKLAKNKARKWKPPDAAGVYEHAAEGEGAMSTDSPADDNPPENLSRKDLWRMLCDAESALGQARGYVSGDDELLIEIDRILATTEPERP